MYKQSSMVRATVVSSLHVYLPYIRECDMITPLRTVLIGVTTLSCHSGIRKQGS